MNHKMVSVFVYLVAVGLYIFALRDHLDGTEIEYSIMRLLEIMVLLLMAIYLKIGASNE
jgi:hypothetical protein